MSERAKTRYNLESRTLEFTKRVIEYIDKLPKTLTNIEIGKQLIRSAGSVGANYIEANEALSKKDFIMRIKISRKEAKESRYWLSLANPAADFPGRTIESLRPVGCQCTPSFLQRMDRASRQSLHHRSSPGHGFPLLGETITR